MSLKSSDEITEEGQAQQEQEQLAMFYDKSAGKTIGQAVRQSQEEKAIAKGNAEATTNNALINTNNNTNTNNNNTNSTTNNNNNSNSISSNQVLLRKIISTKIRHY